MFGKKFSSNIRRKKRMMISTIILLVVFLGIGYAAFTTDLSIGGTLNVKKYDHTLYGVLEKAVSQGYAREYTGEHHDSFTEEPSKKIYHWYATNNTAGDPLAAEILNKNNVIFADHCWQMIRTTDTGGVKMIYNGEPENNQCLDTRGTHVGYNTRKTYTLDAGDYYGTSYTYDKTNNLFSLAGTITTGTIEVGNYTCMSDSATDTCDELYYINHAYSSTRYSVIRLNGDSDFQNFGLVEYKYASESPADVGYMNNKYYPVESDRQVYRTENAGTSVHDEWYYSDTIDYGNISTGKYTLIDPKLVSTLSDHSEIVGKYILSTGDSGSGTKARYIVGLEEDVAKYRTLSDGDTIISLVAGDSYTDNGDGTYTLTNPVQVSFVDWYNGGYANYENKYICDGTSATCSVIKHVDADNVEDISYCYWGTEEKYKYSSSVSYSNGTYTLTGDVKEIWDVPKSTDQELLSTHHYTCFTTGTTCSTVNYVYAHDRSGYLRYVPLSEGINVETALSNMLNADDVNRDDSVVKEGVDGWYKRYLINYANSLEDTIFCNDRNIESLGGWDPNGGSIEIAADSYLKFKNYTLNSDISCTNVTDKFSLANNKAKLTYPIGLLTAPEARLLTNNNLRKAVQAYWLMSPLEFMNRVAVTRQIINTGQYTSVSYSTGGLRPVISLKPGTEYASGTGSMADPYVVDVRMGTLTINYRSETGTILHEPLVVTLPIGASYSYKNPVIPGYQTDDEYATGTISLSIAQVDVVYIVPPDNPPLVGD